MAAELEQKAVEAFIDDDLTLAVDLYTQAISLNPKDANLFADRAQASIKLKNFTEAVVDTDRAIELDPLLAKAYLRKGTACIKLGEYHTAKAILEVGASIVQSDSRFEKLIKECGNHITENKQPLAPKEPECMATSETNGGKNPSRQMMKCTPLVKQKYRHEFYQKLEEVVVTVFAKGIPAKDVAVDFGEQILSVKIDTLGQSDYHLQLRLFGKVIPEKCRYAVLSTKIEIRLAKAEAINWVSLEFGKEATAPHTVQVKTKEWDKLEARLKKEEKQEKVEGDAGTNKLFRDIYQSADEDARRAMMKSYVESKGTVLSTDWKEVGSKRVETIPPSGMEPVDR